MSALRLLYALLMVVAPALASAHDYWLQAESYDVPADAHLVVHLNMGEGLKPEEEKVYEREHTERFELRLPNDVRDLLAATNDGAKPLFDDSLPAPGPFLMTMVRGSAQIELDAAKFE